MTAPWVAGLAEIPSPGREPSRAEILALCKHLRRLGILRSASFRAAMLLAEELGRPERDATV